ncbi:MAG TPA: DUF1629 domain-containing protein [Gemmataceae bacterium]|nr:DUF1629 domain-containing protein [Gemmataceae bacterium]
MRKFYRIYLDAQRDLQVIRAYEDDDFATTVFTTGLPFHGTFPLEVRYFVSEGGIADYLPNARSWQIVSPRFLTLFRQFSSDFQTFDPPIFEAASKKRVTDYKLINVTRCLKALDLDKSKTRYLDMLGHKILHVFPDGFVFKGDLIPADVHIFRPVEAPNAIVVSEEFVKAIKENKIRGVGLIKTKTI